MRRALVALLIAGLAVAVGVYTLGIAEHDATFSFAGTSIVGRVALLGAGLALVMGGLAFWLSRPAGLFGALLVAGGLAWFLLEWNSSGVASSLAFTLGLVFYASCPAPVAHALLAFPSGRLSSRLECVMVATAYVGTLLLLGFLPALFFDPAATCGDCARNLLLVAGEDTTADRLTRVGLWVVVASALGLALLIALKVIRSSSVARRSGGLVLAPGGVYLGLVAAMYAASLPHGLLWNGVLERRLWLGQAVALVAVVIGLAWSRARARRGRAAVARLVVELAQSPPPGGLRDSLATIVGDPTLELVYPVEGSGRLVDAQGHAVVLGAGKEQTTLVGGGRSLAVVAHAPGVLDDDQLVVEVAAAARLALENERLQAEVSASLDELRRSRARIVEAGDGERRRLESDLHDGAQQHLVGLSLSLRLLRTRLPAGANPVLTEKLAAAETDLQDAIEELRKLAHGIFPAVLGDGGLRAAVCALAEDTRVPIRIESLPADRYPPVIESAAYMVVAAVAAAAKERIVVRADRSDVPLVLEIEALGVTEPLDLADLEDHVGAAEGRLTLKRLDGAVRIRAEFPCGS